MEISGGATCVLINEDHLIHNMNWVRKRVSENVLVTAVIKGDAYGHGAVRCAKIFLDHGANRLAVATIKEALELRRAGITAPIMVLGFVSADQLEIAIQKGIILSIYNENTAQMISQIAERIGIGACVHVKLDTGMSRIGFQVSEQTVEAISRIATLPNIDMEGIFSHLACADASDKTKAKKQLESFQWMVDRLQSRGVKIKIRHIANSAAIVDLLPDFQLDMVRAGIILYGLKPSNEVHLQPMDVKPAMTFRTVISHVKYIESGVGVSYSHKFISSHRMKIGTIPVGYADGYTRLLSSKITVGLRGKCVQQVGNICMDQCMIDLEGVKAEVGDEVILFGDGSNGYPTADFIASLLGTINYEVVCMVSRRVPRYYIRGGKIVHQIDYLE